MSRLILGALAAVLVLVLAPAAAGAAEPRTTLPDVEDEVMCVQCGTALNISTSAVADDQRDFIQQRIDRGMSKDEIKAALVEEFGPDVLAMPDADGFNLAVYAVPGALGLLGLVGVGYAAHSWRRKRSSGPEPAAEETALDPDYARRVDAELAAFDR